MAELESASLPLDSGASPAGDAVTETTLRGEVEKVIYQSDDDSFSILNLKDSQGNLHCVCGAVSGAYAGQGIEVTGKWEFHKEHGRRLKVSSYSFTLPTTTEGIEKYLASGIIKGIGAKYAKEIVKTFGDKTLKILDNASVRLREVPGLGQKRIKAIKKSWAENAEKRNAQICLQSLGITPAYFNRIYNNYGNECAEIIRKDPYRLASDIDGIGFIMADRIAEKSGIGKADAKRLKSGVTYALSQIRLSGHVCMPRGEFIQTVARLLDVEEANAEQALELALLEDLAVIRRSHSGIDMVYEPGLLRCEEELPKLIANLAVREKHFGHAVLNFRTPPDSKFSGEQLRAVETAGASAFSIITGGPGVGKTTVVSEIVRRASAAKLNIVLAAPTGRAAKRMSETTGLPASTIHRLLKWDPAERRFVHGRANPLQYELYVLDEVSMLDLPLSVAFFRAVRPGACVILVGDADQLPSVGPGNVLNDLIECGLVPVSRLTKIFRQGAGSGIIHAAHNVNEGKMPDDGLHYPKNELADFYWIEKEEPEEAADVIERMMIDRIPARFGFDPKNDIQLITPMNRGVCGTVAMNERLQALVNGESKLAFTSAGRTFRIGDRVMQTSNNYDKGVFNGDMGRVMVIRHSDSEFVVRFDLNDVTYSFEDAEQLTLAYAVTIHKSQGSEFPVVIMPILSQHYMMLQRNLLYTGMTRAKKLMILVGSRKAVSMAVRNAVREPRHSLLRERLEDAFREKGAVR